MRNVLAAAAITIVSVHAAHGRTPGTIEGLSRTSMTTILQGMGMQVEDRTPPGDLPWLVVKSATGRTFNVNLYVCSKAAPDFGTPCEQVQLRIIWNNSNGRSAADVNAFHLEKVFGRGYVTAKGDDIGVEHAMHLAGGVTERNVRENINYFLRAADDFEELVKP
jgi:hypothetical protein